MPETSRMAENKPRKRGRRKLADSTPPAIAEEEPSRKRPKRLSTQSESPKATGKKEKALKSTGGKGLRSEVTSGRPRRADKKKLLISLNIEDNDLQVHGQAEAAELAVPKPGSRGGGRGRGRSRQNGVNDHRSQSVGSDGGGSTNSSVVSSNNNGRTSACFKNPNFTVSCMLYCSLTPQALHRNELKVKVLPNFFTSLGTMLVVLLH